MAIEKDKIAKNPFIECILLEYIFFTLFFILDYNTDLLI
jgi:hypothetical protein